MAVSLMNRSAAHGLLTTLLAECALSLMTKQSPGVEAWAAVLRALDRIISASRSSSLAESSARHNTFAFKCSKTPILREGVHFAPGGAPRI
eukprot:225260-Pyramimonas_sp.AAC.2